MYVMYKNVNMYIKNKTFVSYRVILLNSLRNKCLGFDIYIYNVYINISIYICNVLSYCEHCSHDFIYITIMVLLQG